MVALSPKPHFRVTAGLFLREGKILITRRPQGSHLGGFWEFPGGKQEGAESLEECLEREIREELDMEVRPERLLLEVTHEYDTRVVSLFLFHCTLLSGEPKPLECDEVRWVRPEELDRYPMPPPDMQMIEYVKGWRERDGG